MDELIKRMLSIRSRFSPVNGPCLVRNGFPIKGYVLTVAFHRQLLQVRGETLQVLVIRQNSDRRRIEEIAVPHSQKAHERRNISIERCVTKVLVDLMEPIEHRPEIVGAK